MATVNQVCARCEAPAAGFLCADCEAAETRVYTTHKVTADIIAFRLPNFLHIGNRSGPTMSVGDLADEDAEKFWDWMKAEWLEHVRKRREIK